MDLSKKVLIIHCEQLFLEVDWFWFGKFTGIPSFPFIFSWAENLRKTSNLSIVSYIFRKWNEVVTVKGT